MKGIVKLNEFVKHLKDNDLMIVRKEDYYKNNDLELARLQKAFFKKKDVTIKQVIDAKVVKVTSKQAILHWFKSGKLRGDEHYKNSKGINMIKVRGIVRILQDPKFQSIFYQN